MAISPRLALLLLALVGAGWLAAFGEKTPAPAGVRGSAPPAAASAAWAPRATAPGRPAPAEPLAMPRARSALADAAGAPVADLFARPAWLAVSPPAPAAVAPAPPPPAPPVAWPYRVIGYKLEAGNWEVFLMRDELSFIAREGQTLESAWRVDRIAPPNMGVTHLLSGREHSVQIGEAR
jgi:hypothetical protein